VLLSSVSSSGCSASLWRSHRHGLYQGIRKADGMAEVSVRGVASPSSNKSSTANVSSFHNCSTLPHPFKFIIAGNHDFGLCTVNNWYATRGKELHQDYDYEVADIEAIKNAVKKWESSKDGMHKYLEDEMVEFELKGKKWSIYGSPVSTAG
jgi:hypothetical protein